MHCSLSGTLSWGLLICTLYEWTFVVESACLTPPPPHSHLLWDDRTARGWALVRECILQANTRLQLAESKTSIRILLQSDSDLVKGDERIPRHQVHFIHLLLRLLGESISVWHSLEIKHLTDHQRDRFLMNVLHNMVLQQVISTPQLHRFIGKRTVGI